MPVIKQNYAYFPQSPEELRNVTRAWEILQNAIERQTDIDMTVCSDTSVLLTTEYEEKTRCPSSYLTPAEYTELEKLGWHFAEADDVMFPPYMHLEAWGTYWYRSFGQS